MLAAFDVFMAVYGVLMGAGPLLQLRRMLTTRSSDDVSLSMLLVLAIGGALWILYGIAHQLPSIIVANSVGVTSATATVMVARRYR